VGDEQEDERGEDDSFPLLERILLGAGTRCRSVTRREDDPSAGLGDGKGATRCDGVVVNESGSNNVPPPDSGWSVASTEGSRRVIKAGRKVHRVYLDDELSVVCVAISVPKASARMQLESHADEQAAPKPLWRLEKFDPCLRLQGSRHRIALDDRGNEDGRVEKGVYMRV
jgi:hypothetical protein